ncbi:hypothetical protein C8J57DRAFT_1240922 [Mycena rebaudengoi]|nr:hypothetical protein C8J57DRAFT_1240922 [Mycena rebaudengoi]
MWRHGTNLRRLHKRLEPFTCGDTSHSVGVLYRRLSLVYWRVARSADLECRKFVVRDLDGVPGVAVARHNALPGLWKIISLGRKPMWQRLSPRRCFVKRAASLVVALVNTLTASAALFALRRELKVPSEVVGFHLSDAINVEVSQRLARLSNSGIVFFGIERYAQSDSTIDSCLERDNRGVSSEKESSLSPVPSFMLSLQQPTYVDEGVDPVVVEEEAPPPLPLGIWLCLFESVFTRTWKRKCPLREKHFLYFDRTPHYLPQHSLHYSPAPYQTLKPSRSLNKLSHKGDENGRTSGDMNKVVVDTEMFSADVEHFQLYHPSVKISTPQTPAAVPAATATLALPQGNPSDRLDSLCMTKSTAGVGLTAAANSGNLPKKDHNWVQNVPISNLAD